jgi:type IV secretion system protein VirB3
VSSLSSSVSEAGVTADPLFVGATRPAMALGVPYAALLANAFLTLELFLVTRNLLWLLTAVPLHGLAWLVCLAEPRSFELLAVWGQVRARAGFRGRRPWRAVSYGAFRPRADGRSRSLPCVIVETQELR